MEIVDRTEKTVESEPELLPVQESLPLAGAPIPVERPIIVSADTVEPIRRKKKRGRPRKEDRSDGDPIIDQVSPPVETTPVQNQVSTGAELLTARALVETLGAVLQHWLPPAMSEAEKDVLIAAWAPVIRMYQDQWFTSPWTVAIVATSGVLIPRIAAQIQSDKPKPPLNV